MLLGESDCIVCYRGAEDGPDIILDTKKDGMYVALLSDKGYSLITEKQLVRALRRFMTLGMAVSIKNINHVFSINDR